MCQGEISPFLGLNEIQVSIETAGKQDPATLCLKADIPRLRCALLVLPHVQSESGVWHACNLGAGPGSQGSCHRISVRLRLTSIRPFVSLIPSLVDCSPWLAKASFLCQSGQFRPACEPTYRCTLCVDSFVPTIRSRKSCNLSLAVLKIVLRACRSSGE